MLNIQVHTVENLKLEILNNINFCTVYSQDFVSGPGSSCFGNSGKLFRETIQEIAKNSLKTK